MSLKKIRSKAYYYLVLSVYFLLWSYKTEIRDKVLRWVGFGLISISPVLLGTEIVAEFFKDRWIPKLYSISSHPKVTIASFIFSIVGLIYLIWHHWREAKKPGYEYAFVKRLCDMMEGRHARRGLKNNAALAEALRLFYGVFERAGVEHVAIHLPEGKLLRIPRQLVYPRESNATFFIDLRIGQGVAGAVYQDNKPRYVPRTYFPFPKWSPRFPTSFFPHAVRFEFVQVNDPVFGGRRYELGNEEIDAGIVEMPDGKVIPFQSFLSVPMKTATGVCLGVLSFDFKRSDPLDKADIAMAAIFGILLAEEMEALTAVKGKST